MPSSESDFIENIDTESISLGERIEYLEFLKSMVEAGRVQFSAAHSQLVKDLSKVKNSPLGYPDPLTASPLVLILAHVVWRSLYGQREDTKYYITEVNENSIVGALVK